MKVSIKEGKFTMDLSTADLDEQGNLIKILVDPKTYEISISNEPRSKGDGYELHNECQH